MSAGLRAAVEALCDEWEQRAIARRDTGPDTSAHAASELRALLAPTPDQQAIADRVAAVLAEVVARAERQSNLRRTFHGPAVESVTLNELRAIIAAALGASA
jgi:hypothetical protein